MRKTIFTICLLLAILSVHGQRQEQIDSLVNELCRSIEETKGEKDSVRIFIAVQKHLLPTISKLPADQQDGFWDRIFFRMQRNCEEFKSMLDRTADENSSDWIKVEQRPRTVLSRSECKRFGKQRKFKYLEMSGDTVNLEIDQAYWIDRFKDGTYSKLKFYWLGDCEFEIEFLESNNETRKGFSKRGDKYRYQIIDKTDTYYVMSAEIPNENIYWIFKLHF